MLTELIETAIHQNLDVQQAVLRVLEARQGIVTARSAGLPTLSGNATYQRDQLGAKGILESQGVYGDLNSLADRAQTVGGGALGTEPAPPPSTSCWRRSRSRSTCSRAR